MNQGIGQKLYQKISSSWWEIRVHILQIQPKFMLKFYLYDGRKMCRCSKQLFYFVTTDIQQYNFFLIYWIFTLRILIPVCGENFLDCLNTYKSIFYGFLWHNSNNAINLKKNFGRQFKIFAFNSLLKSCRCFHGLIQYHHYIIPSNRVFCSWHIFSLIKSDHKKVVFTS